MALRPWSAPLKATFGVRHESFHEPAHSNADEESSTPESGVDGSAESIAFETDIVGEGPNTISSAVQLDDD